MECLSPADALAGLRRAVRQRPHCRRIIHREREERDPRAAEVDAPFSLRVWGGFLAGGKARGPHATDHAGVVERLGGEEGGADGAVCAVCGDEEVAVGGGGVGKCDADSAVGEELGFCAAVALMDGGVRGNCGEEQVAQDVAHEADAGRGYGVTCLRGLLLPRVEVEQRLPLATPDGWRGFDPIVANSTMR